MLYELFYGKCPYECFSMEELKRRTKAGDVKFPMYINRVSKYTQKLLRQMLIADPEKRISWAQLFKYDWSYLEPRRAKA